MTALASTASMPYCAILSGLSVMRSSGWPKFLNTPKSSTPFTFLRTLKTSVIFLSNTFKSLPWILTAMLPFTPETASATLSEIGCEKPKSTPLKSTNLACISDTSSSLLMERFHSSLGYKSTKNSWLKKPVGSVPSLGRPVCEITPRTSGNCSNTCRNLRVKW